MIVNKISSSVIVVFTIIFLYINKLIYYIQILIAIIKLINNHNINIHSHYPKT